MVLVKTFFDEETSTLTHIVYDPKTQDAVVIDPVMDFDLQTFSLRQTSSKRILDFCTENHLELHHIFETHAHADHISGSQILKRNFPQAKVGIGGQIAIVQKHFSDFYDLGAGFPCDGSQFDQLYSNGGEIDAGSFSIKTWHTPGHTPADYTLEIEDKLFSGDILFAPDLGTGRCDFPGGDAVSMFRSVKEVLYKKPDSYTVYFGHDYPEERGVVEYSSLAIEKTTNTRLNLQTLEDDFLRFREQRDRNLEAPRLMLVSLLFNINAGRIPQKRKNGRHYISLPLQIDL